MKYFGGGEEQDEDMVAEAWKSISPSIQTKEISHSEPHGHGSWGLIFWFSPNA